MGFFGGLVRVVGRVAKAGLSKVTHGASDHVFKVLKGRGTTKQVLAKGPQAPPTQQDAALVRKLLPIQRLPLPPTLGSEDSVLNAVGRKANLGYKAKASWKKKSKRAASAPSVVVPSFSRSSGAKMMSRSASSSRPKRSLPPALAARAQRMKALAAQWRADGKPGRWIDYVKAAG